MPRKAPAAEVERPVGTQVESDVEGQVESDAAAPVNSDAAIPVNSDAAAQIDDDRVLVDLVGIVIEVDEDACRVRAFEISLSDEAGTPEENWVRAEHELRGSPASAAEK